MLGLTAENLCCGSRLPGKTGKARRICGPREWLLQKSGPAPLLTGLALTRMLLRVWGYYLLIQRVPVWLTGAGSLQGDAFSGGGRVSYRWLSDLGEYLISSILRSLSSELFDGAARIALEGRKRGV